MDPSVSCSQYQIEINLPPKRAPGAIPPNSANPSHQVSCHQSMPGSRRARPCQERVERGPCLQFKDRRRPGIRNALLQRERRPREGAPLHRLQWCVSPLQRIVHVEFDRMRGHFEALDFGHLQLDVASMKSSSNTPPFLRKARSLSRFSSASRSEPQTVGIFFSSSGGRS